jgi:hypothetical protein
MLNGYFLLQSPTNEGPWLEQYSRLATVEINGNTITINNYRRARYDDKGNISQIQWENRQLNLDALNAIWYGISTFASPGLAHTFISFDFGDKDPVVISVEARMRPGESYHPLEGALDAYHLIYVFADEQDILGVRIHKRLEDVRFMPIVADKDRIKKMFLDMAARANSLSNEPEFYNTFTSNCTNNILQQTDVPAWQYYLDPRIILPGYSDSIAYEFGVLNTDYSLEELRQASRIAPTYLSKEGALFYQDIRKLYYANLENFH